MRPRADYGDVAMLSTEMIGSSLKKEKRPAPGSCLHQSSAKLSLLHLLFFNLSWALTGGRMDALARGLYHKRACLTSVTGRLDQ